MLTEFSNSGWYILLGLSYAEGGGGNVYSLAGHPNGFLKPREFLKIFPETGLWKTIPLHFFLQMQDIRSPEGSQYSSHPPMAAMRPRAQPAELRQQPGVLQHGQLTTINQSQLSAQLGLNMAGSSVPHSSPSPPGSKSATPSPSSSVHEDEGDDTSKVWLGYFGDQ